MNNNIIKSITIKENEPFLRQISHEVDIKNDNELENDISVLDTFCNQNEVMAMAAVQLGIPKRIIYLKNTNLDVINNMNEKNKKYNEKRILINPVILKREGLTQYWEACASCLDTCGRVLRPYRIEIEYYDSSSNKHLETFEGFESTVLSHEMDHLDGILHIDIAEEVLIMTKAERVLFRKNHDYEIISKKDDYDTLKKNYHK